MLNTPGGKNVLRGIDGEYAVNQAKTAQSKLQNFRAANNQVASDVKGSLNINDRINQRSNITESGTNAARKDTYTAAQRSAAKAKVSAAKSAQSTAANPPALKPQTPNVSTPKPPVNSTPNPTKVGKLGKAGKIAAGLGLAGAAIGGGLYLTNKRKN